MVREADWQQFVLAFCPIDQRVSASDVLQPRQGENRWRGGFHLGQQRIETAGGARGEEAIFAAIQKDVWVHVRPVEQDENFQRAMNVNPVIRAEPFRYFLKLPALVAER